MKKAILNALSIFGFRRSDPEAETKRDIARYSRGNVRLQSGQIMTYRDYAAQRESVLAHVFR